MNWFLLPDDEAELLKFVSEELGLVQVLGEGWHSGGLPRQYGKQPSEIVWWASDLGPIRRMADAPPPTDA